MSEDGNKKLAKMEINPMIALIIICAFIFLMLFLAMPPIIHNYGIDKRNEQIRVDREKALAVARETAAVAIKQTDDAKRISYESFFRSAEYEDPFLEGSRTLLPAVRRIGERCVLVLPIGRERDYLSWAASRDVYCIYEGMKNYDSFTVNRVTGVKTSEPVALTTYTILTDAEAERVLTSANLPLRARSNQ